MTCVVFSRFDLQKNSIALIHASGSEVMGKDGKPTLSPQLSLVNSFPSIAMYPDVLPNNTHKDIPNVG